MRCPFCGNEETKVLESRPVEEGSAVRRRRECDHCTRRFTTYEKYEDFPLIVVKKDGRRESFSRQKLMAGISKACEKRPISIEQIENLAYDIEKYLRDTFEREVTAKDIGEAVMDKLFTLDEVAYIRFASVYLQFADIERFRQELNELEKRRRLDRGQE